LAGIGGKGRKKGEEGDRRYVLEKVKAVRTLWGEYE